MKALAERYESHRRAFERAGQAHVLRFWEQLSEPQRSELLNDLDQINVEQCAPLIDSYVRKQVAMQVPRDLHPPDAFPADPRPEQRELYERASRAGAQAISAGRVAAFTVAGGQGTRLGYDGPKGGFRISPVRSACLFQLFAESLLGVQRKYGRRPRWYIMTSPSNHDATLQIFEANRYFGLARDDLMFFPQGQMPAFLPDGRIALAEKHRVALAPDGHGGSLTALSASGALEDMRERGIQQISYFQVDNPLVKTIDPLFVGLHVLTGSEMSSKAVAKSHDLERVGVFAQADNRLTVIEYSDLPRELATAKNPDGTRHFDAGSIAIHVLDRDFVARLTAAGAAQQLPWHRAEKKVDVVDEQGRAVKPDKPNVVKLERFVFDAIPLASRPLVLFTPRAEEFSPVKNAEGADSPATTRRDMVRRAARWLESAAVTVPRAADGEPAAALEISPAYALDAADLAEQLAGRKPSIQPGEPFLLV